MPSSSRATGYSATTTNTRSVPTRTLQPSAFWGAARNPARWSLAAVSGRRLCLLAAYAAQAVLGVLCGCIGAALSP
jgi:hypothetical protein